jgi:uncharacterized protein
MFNLLPKDAKFYDELEELSSLVINSSQNLGTIVDNFHRLDGQLDAIERSRIRARTVYGESLLRLLTV